MLVTWSSGEKSTLNLRSKIGWVVQRLMCSEMTYERKSDSQVSCSSSMLSTTSSAKARLMERGIALHSKKKMMDEDNAVEVD